MSLLHVEVCLIDRVEKHPNADRLDIATVKGWSCVVGLNQFSQGQKVVYIPPDSIIPKDLIEKYRLYTEEVQEDGSIIKKTYFKTEYKDGSCRMTTQKLRGAVSQGIILPLSIEEEARYSIGTDLSKELKIKKWEPEIAEFAKNLVSTPKKMNPLFDRYTNIENIKNYNKVFKEGDQVYVMEKIHGTNFRAGRLPIYNNKKNILTRIITWIKKKKYGTHEFVYGSHNVQLENLLGNKTYYSNNVYSKIAKRYNLKNTIPNDYIVYGEIYGNKIQDLTYGLADIELAVFDVKYKGMYLSYNELIEFCVKYNLDVAPILYVGEWNEDLINKFTNGKSTLCSSQIREGCVICSKEESNDMFVGRKILKSISVDYLTRKNATEYH